MSEHRVVMPKSTTNPGLQVIGAGLPRTSTVSLQSALHTLGYNPAYHTISDMLPNARTQGALWLRAMISENKAVRQKILAELVKGYVAVVDGPACFFVKDFIEMFPDARVVLGLRDTPEAWLNSINTSIGKVFGTPPMYYICYFIPVLSYGFALNNLWDQQAKEKYGVGVRTTEFYVRHQQYIRSIVPKEKLLEFKAGDGWGPLCGFLGEDVPEEEYPHKNDSKSANVIIRSFLIYGVGVWVGIALCGWGAVRGVRHLLELQD